jgi:hypothetical protein
LAATDGSRDAAVDFLDERVEMLDGIEKLTFCEFFAQVAVGKDK